MVKKKYPTKPIDFGDQYLREAIMFTHYNNIELNLITNN